MKKIRLHKFLSMKLMIVLALVLFWNKMNIATANTLNDGVQPAATTPGTLQKELKKKVEGSTKKSGFLSKKDLQKNKQACDNGDITACTMFASDTLSRGNESEGKLYFTKSCDGGDSLSCEILGTMAKKDGNTAEESRLYKRACDNGSSNGCKSLKSTQIAIETKNGCNNGVLAECTTGCNNDDIAQCTIGCNDGDVAECATLGFHFELIGKETAAEQLYKKACDSGRKEGVKGCGQLAAIANSHGHHYLAFQFFKKACSGGDLTSCGAAGGLAYQFGEVSEAIRLYKKACSGGDMFSCTELGTIKANQGKRSEALHYFRIACNHDNSLTSLSGCALIHETSEDQEEKRDAMNRLWSVCNNGNELACSLFKLK